MESQYIVGSQWVMEISTGNAIPVGDGIQCMMETSVGVGGGIPMGDGIPVGDEDIGGCGWLDPNG